MSCASFAPASTFRLPDEEVAETPFYRPPLDSRETQYLLERRKQLGGFVPERKSSS